MSARPDFSRYIVEPPDAEAWGIVVTGCGRQRCSAGSAYPPPGHPADHLFSWENGRVLGACQIVLISEGRGLFESRATGLVKVTAGTAIVVLPGVWHRYAPDPKTGWTERWIELRGPIPTALFKKGVLGAAHSLTPIERSHEMGELMDRIEARMSGSTAAFDPEAAALGLQVLSLVTERPGERSPERPITSLVAKAERRLLDSVDTPPAIPGLARELGVAYSYFRREFKRHTGLAPYQYVRRLRLEKARRMIGNSTESLQSISEQLGFASPFHLSSAFKKQYGQSPDHWRRHRG
jgi:AraC-like DNA-binding protein